MGICFGISAKAPRVSSTQSYDSNFVPPSNVMQPKEFTYIDLKRATRNFQPDNQLGKGGSVYKGYLDETSLRPAKPENGTAVAVKRLREPSSQGHSEWLAEVKYLSQYNHENLVKLIGYCIEPNNVLLVYEFMERGSLDNHLFRREGQVLSWVRRIQIARDVAQGLSFLHSLDANIIFRDLNSANILLDSDFKAKLADYNLAGDGSINDRSYVNARVLRCTGYEAPEYLKTGRMTLKCNVYSFGVLLLELLSGRQAYYRNRDPILLVDWATPFLDNKQVRSMIDTRLEDQYSKKVAFSVAALSLKCIDEDRNSRPIMQEVLATLEHL